MLDDGDFLSFLKDELVKQGLSNFTASSIISEVRCMYGGDEVYICKREKVNGEQIRDEVKKTSVAKVAKKYRKSRGFVYNYLK